MYDQVTWPGESPEGASKEDSICCVARRGSKIIGVFNDERLAKAWMENEYTGDLAKTTLDVVPFWYEITDG